MGHVSTAGGRPALGRPGDGRFPFDCIPELRVSEIWVLVRCDPPKIITHLPILVEHASCPQNRRDCNCKGKGDYEAEADQTGDLESAKQINTSVSRGIILSRRRAHFNTLFPRTACRGSVAAGLLLGSPFGCIGNAPTIKIGRAHV